jgi:inorganic phosphate transporter, PiT family
MAIFLYLSSGLFLGWSLGANHTANVFGTAVGSRMVRFETAAVICTVFVILGATFSGAGAAHTLGRLGDVNALAGSFTVCLAAALAIAWMTRLGLPVSTSEAMVGGILGWNLYTTSATDPAALARIVGTWAVCPVLAAVLAAGLFLAVRAWHRRSGVHLLAMDSMTRWGLLIVGAFGAYSLGANNIANVMGVFVRDNPFKDIVVGGRLTITGTQQLFFLGAAAIGVGVFTYSRRVIETVGGGVMRFSPLAALVVVLAHSIVLFLFASEGLEHILIRLGLPTFPLVPVSSSQALIGAIIGIGLVRGGRELQWKTLGQIAVGWAATPLLALVLTFVSLFFVENVFRQEVVHRSPAASRQAAAAEHPRARALRPVVPGTLDGAGPGVRGTVAGVR